MENLGKVKGDDGFSDVCKNGKGGEEITVKTSTENIGWILIKPSICSHPKLCLPLNLSACSDWEGLELVQLQ